MTRSNPRNRQHGRDDVRRAEPLHPRTEASGVAPDKQLDFAKESVAQVLTLSSAILAFSLTFSQGWAAEATSAETVWLKLAWIAFVLAIVLGLWALLALTGLAVLRTANVGKLSFRLPWLLETVCFLVGLVLLLVFGWLTVNG